MFRTTRPSDRLRGTGLALLVLGPLLLGSSCRVSTVCVDATDADGCKPLPQFKRVRDAPFFAGRCKHAKSVLLSENGGDPQKIEFVDHGKEVDDQSPPPGTVLDSDTDLVLYIFDDIEQLRRWKAFRQLLRDLGGLARLG